MSERRFGPDRPDEDDRPSDTSREADAVPDPAYGTRYDNVVDLVTSRSYPSTSTDRPELAEADVSRCRAIEAVTSAREITHPDAPEALGRAYDVTCTYTAPVIVKAAHDMLPDLRAEVDANPERGIVFVGRDGHSLAAAVYALDPDFFDEHCKQAVVSRAVVESAVQDLEVNAGADFPELHDFRAAHDKVDPDDVTGSFQRLSMYLRSQEIAVGQPGSEVTLVDTSYKGTVQELLTAIYPETSFHGRYVFFGASPHDPHRGTKTGYVLHLDVGESQGGRPVTTLPDDAQLTFAHNDAVAVVEETLHGPMSSPRSMTDTGPEQTSAPAPLSGINPELVPDVYKDLGVRGGVLDINLIAVRDYADSIAAGLARNEDVQVELDESVQDTRSTIRGWISGEQTDPAFANVMDSFVRRADKAYVSTLDTALGRSDLSPDEVAGVWRSYGELQSLDDKKEFVMATEARIGGQSHG